LILSWADGGAPSGVLLVDEDKQPVFIPPLNNWELGTPDAVVKFADDVKVAADAPYRVDRFEVATGLKQAKWLRALQLNPTDRHVVHYAAFYDARDGRWLGTWTPSSQVSAMPSGSGVQLPSGAKLSVEIGYRGNMEDGSGAAELGFYFLEKPAAQTPSMIDIAAAPISVAAGKKAERVRAETTIKTPATITAMWPRPGAGATSLEIIAIRPDGGVEPMLWVNNYRADWPSSYILKEPMALPAGTRLLMTAYYDNTTAAPLAAKPLLTLTALPSRLRESTTP
jgi:hypothetical protein